jgi:hypothetical protein
LKVEAGCAADLSDIPNVSQRGNRLGNWLTREQAKELDAGTRSLDTEEEAGLAILALLVGSLFEEKTRNRILSTLSPC